MTPTPPPPAERALVECYAVRWGADSRYEGSLSDFTDNQPSAQWEVDHADDKAGTGTVVPLIAADRLTDEATLVAVIEAMHDRCDEKCGDCVCDSRAIAPVLAALRAHLESK